MMDGQTRLMVLEKGLKDEKSVYRLKIGWKLSFTCDPLLQAENVRIFWNHPSTSTGKINYAHYEELSWQKNDKLSEGYDFITEEKIIQRPGAFHYFYTIDGSVIERNRNGYGYLIVDPNLTVGVDDKPLNMDAVQLQTVLPKLLGTFPEWKNRLLVSHKSGYNMIHFTPIQSLNRESNSSYSISDQLSINPAFSTADFTCNAKDIKGLVKQMKYEWNTLSVTDMVYNHTANDSDWLNVHPESSYNLSNSPHLKSAYLIDRLVYYTSQKVAAQELVDFGIPAKLTSQEHLDALKVYLQATIKVLDLHEFYTVEVQRSADCFTTALHEVIATLRRATPTDLVKLKKTSCSKSLVIHQDPQYRRLESTVDVKEALLLYTDRITKICSSDKSLDNGAVGKIVDDFTQQLASRNEEKIRDLERHVDSALDNIVQGVKYRFINEDGPKLVEVTALQPLVDYYFINKKSGYIALTLELDVENIKDEKNCQYIMAHNGWVFGDDPLKNFAKPDSQVYLRRELVVWGDSVKLRYGDAPADSPYLWQRMEEYTKQTVEIFHGIRLDNCHSTPIHVAEHMMRYARSIRPNLYVMAELFTSHEDTDNLFVNRLGLNSLIREGLNAWDAHEQGRLAYRYGGRPVGSFVQPNVQLLRPTVAHALFMDATHDNESIINKRTVYDSLSLSAYTAMACCATGSNRGYDELIPHHIHVVEEARPYAHWDNETTATDPEYCTSSTGMISAKLILNQVHQSMGAEGYDQIYVHDLSSEVVSITRHNPTTHHSCICVVRSAFSDGGEVHPHCDDLTFEGKLSEVILYGRITESTSPVTEFTKHDNFLNGLTSHWASIQTGVSIDHISGLTWAQTSDTKQTISFHHFPRGSVLIIRVLPNDNLLSSQREILKTISSMQEYVSGKGQLSDAAKAIEEMMSKLTLSDLNAIMYHCEAEEKSIDGYGSYNVPQFGALIYTGLQGILSPMARIRTSNDLGHAICQNIREGDWLIEYITNRMKLYPSLKEVADFISNLLGQVTLLPRYLIPSYFDLTLIALSMVINQTVWNKMSRFVTAGSPFVKELALSSQQFCGIVESAKLAKLSPALEVDYKHPTTGELDMVSISAGLPHFSEGIMRIWGRDTFIALRGLLLVTDRFHEARAIILSFAGTLRHGLIPNLHGEGIAARYNCRDAVWWWFQSIQDYCSMAPNGHTLLKAEVLRIYPTDDCEPYGQGNVVQPLMDVMQEALQRHADGITFRERNAGRAIDEHMMDEGFTVVAGIDWITGFVYGGNGFNCGTWMDKMGSSEKAGNKGKPATPRNGSAVELVGLCASTVRWLADVSSRGLYKYEGVAAKRPQWTMPQLVSFSVWYDLIERNFELSFFIDGTYSSVEKDPHPQLINKHNIYKDSVGASPEWADYQLRPNFTIAMVVAPDLFKIDNAVAALDMAESHLVGPLGMKTLDSSDWTYNGDYINSDDSDNHNTARGFNYHNGPEWLWPMGYYLRARLIMAARFGSGKPGALDKTVKSVESKLASHHLAMLSTDWRSLPELTNADGKVCSDSCPAQAWSISCIMDVLYDISILCANLSS